jgi:hypothetical protein
MVVASAVAALGRTTVSNQNSSPKKQKAGEGVRSHLYLGSVVTMASLSRCPPVIGVLQAERKTQSRESSTNRNPLTIGDAGIGARIIFALNGVAEK